VTDPDKRRNKGEETRGRVKENVGNAIGDEDLERQGRKDQGKANMKQAGEKVKDAVKGATGRK
jgi:uncharacterized protein YjbJ (UPF0337 family)